MGQKQGKGKIDWCDYTWNPIKGRCGYLCPYCYMHEMRKRFPMNDELRLDEKELRWSPRKPSRIFVCSSLDMFHPDVSDEWIDLVMDQAHSHQANIYQFLTKNPERYFDFDLPSNAWLGTTVDGTFNTGGNFDKLAAVEYSGVKFVSFEPLIEFPNEVLDNNASWEAIDWIIIGADSRHGAKQPPFSWLSELIWKAALHDVAVFVKDNYPLLDESWRLKEFPVLSEIEVIREPVKYPGELSTCGR